MEHTGRYRHELKYSINYSDYLSMRSRLKLVMRPDANAEDAGTYRIRSIYFDNYRDKALREKINGAARREKFRIRWYNDDLSYITLEKKMKVNDLCMKLNAELTEDECRSLLSGDLGWMPTHEQLLVRELYAKMKNELLRPRVLASYTREPYVFPAGNVRVTFDWDIRSTLFHQSFLEPDIRDVSVSEQPGAMVLEVKYDDYLPEVVSDAIQLGACRQEAFSKYGACRRFG